MNTDQWFLARVICLPRGLWHYLEKFLVVTAGGAGTPNNCRCSFPRSHGSWALRHPPPQWVASQLHLCPMPQHFLWTQELSDLGPGALTGLHQGRVTPDQPLISGAMTHMQSEQKASILKKKGGEACHYTGKPHSYKPRWFPIVPFWSKSFSTQGKSVLPFKAQLKLFPSGSFCPQGEKKISCSSVFPGTSPQHMVAVSSCLSGWNGSCRNRSVHLGTPLLIWYLGSRVMKNELRHWTT